MKKEHNFISIVNYGILDECADCKLIRKVNEKNGLFYLISKHNFNKDWICLRCDALIFLVNAFDCIPCISDNEYEMKSVID